MAKKPYNGHESWTAWNVALWVSNCEYTYKEAVRLKRLKNSKDAAKALLNYLGGPGTETPDGAKYSVHNLTLTIRGL